MSTRSKEYSSTHERLSSERSRGEEMKRTQASYDDVGFSPHEPRAKLTMRLRNRGHCRRLIDYISLARSGEIS